MWIRAVAGAATLCLGACTVLASLDGHEASAPTDAAVIDEGLADATAADGARDSDGLHDAGTDAGDPCAPNPGCTTCRIFASCIPDPTALATTSTHLYWTSIDGSVRRAPLTGGLAEVVATLNIGARPAELKRIFVDGTDIWVAEDNVNNALGNTIWRVPLGGASEAGAPIVTISSAGTNTGISGLATDATSVYWTSGRGKGVRACPKSGCGDGGAVLLPNTSTGDNAHGPVIVGDQLFWTSALVGTTPALNACTVPGCTAFRVLVSAPNGMNGNGKMGVVANGQIAWSVDTPSRVFVTTPASDASAPVATVDGQISDIALDQTRLYVAIEHALVPPLAVDDGTIVSAPIAGGDASVLAKAAPKAMAISATDVYWSSSSAKSTSSTGYIVTMPKP